MFKKSNTDGRKERYRNEKRNEEQKEKRKIKKIEGPKDRKKEESKKERWLIKFKNHVFKNEAQLFLICS